MDLIGFVDMLVSSTWMHSYGSSIVDVCLFGAVIREPVGPKPTSQFEHSSIPATVKKLFNLKSNFLTKRDAWAGTFEHYLKLRDSPRDDCPGISRSRSWWTITLTSMVF